MLVELNCGSVEGLSASEVKDCAVVSDDITLHNRTSYGAFRADYRTHEYLHKFRSRWRHSGFPQGGSLSPLVSVLPLVLIEELKFEIKYLTYCDDGLLFGESERQMGTLLQELFDVHESGVTIHPEKSGWVRLKGEWLKPLKFVGLCYNPFEDILSACTRKGSVLPMQLDLIGLMSKEAGTVKNIISEHTCSYDAVPDFSSCPYDPTRGIECNKSSISPLEERFR
jgi:hypothetical protein